MKGQFVSTLAKESGKRFTFDHTPVSDHIFFNHHNSHFPRASSTLDLILWKQAQAYRRVVLGLRESTGDKLKQMSSPLSGRSQLSILSSPRDKVNFSSLCSVSICKGSSPRGLG